MAEGVELASLGDFRQRVELKDVGVALEIIADLFIEDEEAAVDVAAAVVGFFAEADDFLPRSSFSSPKRPLGRTAVSVASPFFA